MRRDYFSAYWAYIFQSHYVHFGSIDTCYYCEDIFFSTSLHKKTQPTPKLWFINKLHSLQESWSRSYHHRIRFSCGGRNLGAASCFGPWYLTCQSLEWCNTSARCSFPRSPEKRGDIGDSSYQETDVMYLGFCSGISYLCFLRMRIQNLRKILKTTQGTYSTTFDLYVPEMFVENCENPRAPCHFGAPSWLCTKHIVGEITCR